MHIRTHFTSIALLLLATKGAPDPISFIASTPATLLPSPSPLPEFEAKEIIAYLTQEQIEDLKSGRGFLEPVLESQTELNNDKQNLESGQISENNYNNDQLKSLLEQRKKYIKTQSKLVLIGNQKVKDFDEEEHQEAPAQISWYPGEHNRYFTVTSERSESNRNFATTSEKPVNSNYYVSSTERTDNSNYYTATSEKPNNLNHKSINYYSVYNEKKGDNIHIKIFHPTPKDDKETKESDIKKENLSNKKYTSTSRDEEKSRSQKYEQENSNDYERNIEEEEIEPKYAIRFSNNHQVIRIQDLTKKQKVQAEVIAKRPVEIRKKVNTANPLSTPRPYVLHLSQPVDIKAQKTYSIPLEFTRHGPVATGDSEEEQPASYEIERPVSSPGSKQVYIKVDKPYLVEGIVPVDVRKEAAAQATPEKLRILGRVWQHYN